MTQKSSQTGNFWAPTYGLKRVMEIEFLTFLKMIENLCSLEINKTHQPDW